MQRNGFTLLELLIVIAIIGILSILAVPNFIAARQRGRDAQRKNDMKQLQSALELYKNDQSSPDYPNAAGYSSLGTYLSPTYIAIMPTDPIASGTYYYAYTSATRTYSLSSCLENGGDPVGVTCPGGFTCSSAKCFTINSP